MERLVLIDGNAILHRAYHAMPGFTTSKGEPVGAIYGFTAMLLRVIADLKPTYIAVTFDRPKPTFRQELYAGYQQGRPGMVDDLAAQVEGVHTVVAALEIPIFEVDGYEADDCIGTLAVQAVKKNVDVVIVSGDRDLLQLVNGHIKVYMPIKGLSEAKMYGSSEVKEKYGLEPHQVVDMKALMGDASDQYPGVRGIGPKTASLLLQKYHTLENLYEHLGELPQRVGKALAEGTESAGLAKKLATIVTDVPIHLKLIDCKFEIKDKDKDKAITTLESFEFRTLPNRLRELLGEKPVEVVATSKSSLKVVAKKKVEDENQLRLV